MYPKGQKSHRVIFGLYEDGSNGECQENQNLPAPSEVEYYQYEEKYHLIAFLPRFGPPVVEMVQNFVYREITVQTLSGW
jgi:hypothetical protein